MVNAAVKERVGIVGVGRMGLAMLKHLVKHGFAVTACDIHAGQLAKAREAGAPTVASPAEFARGTDFVIIAVGYDEEVNDVVLGAHGLLGELTPGAIIAVSSTAKPDTVKALDARARGRKASKFSMHRSAAGDSRRMKELCWRWSAARRKWSSAGAQSTVLSAPIMSISDLHLQRRSAPTAAVHTRRSWSVISGRRT
jgi:threonine dehydrogenase-like Zn-dependent dehydrogenase